MIKLRNGNEIPAIGLGTYKMTSEQVALSIPIAYECGYRLYDTAAVYRNESAVSKALSAFPRNTLYVTTKVAPKDQGHEKATLAIQASLEKMKDLGYIDLFLVHWPGASGLNPSDPVNSALRKGSWRALEEAYKKGFVKSIGVSNYEIRHLEEMKSYASVMPLVNQIEVHPLFFPKDLIEYCQREEILVQAYSSLAANELVSEECLARFPRIKEISAGHGKKPAQVLLKWALQHRMAIIPKSINEARIKENIELHDFELSRDEMAQLDRLDCNHKVCWDPSTVT